MSFSVIGSPPELQTLHPKFSSIMIRLTAGFLGGILKCVCCFFSFPFSLFLFKLKNSGNNKTTVSPFALWLEWHSKCMKGSKLDFISRSCTLSFTSSCPSAFLTVCCVPDHHLRTPRGGRLSVSQRADTEPGLNSPSGVPPLWSHHFMRGPVS